MSKESGMLGDYHLIEYGSCGIGKKKYIGERFICRFCGASGKEKFKSKAHAIPEFLGNGNLILNSECDECNYHFSKTIEHHLDNYTKPFRTISGIRKKAGGTPTYVDSNSRMKFETHRNNLSIEMRDTDLIQHDRASRILSWDIDRQPFTPALAHKALCKIAASVIDGEEMVELFRPSLDWLNRKNSSELHIEPATVIESIYPGRRISGCVYKIFIRDTKTLPHCIFWIGFGSFSLQTIVPVSLDLQKGCNLTSTLPVHPDIRPSDDIIRHGEMGFIEHDFSSQDATNLPYQVRLSYTDILE